MLRFIAVIILVLTPVIAQAGWDYEDSGREVVWQGLHVIDWGQTLEIARHPGNYYEANPIMGRHPSLGRVNLYMGASAVVHAGISYVLPEDMRKWWQYVSIGVSGACVAHNFNMGLGVKF
jgi:hypothetical protein